MSRITVLLGSTRPQRFGAQIAEWIMNLSKEHQGSTFELVDLKEVGLPFLDEPAPPIAGNYQHDHTKAWATRIDSTDGFIVITPEYNHGVPAALKNAIDFAAKEWFYKPVAYVSYGADAGGQRAVEHLRASAGHLNMYDISDHVTITNYWQYLDDHGKFQPSPQHLKDARAALAEVAFWAEALRPIRAQKTA